MKGIFKETSSYFKNTPHDGGKPSVRFAASLIALCFIFVCAFVPVSCTIEGGADDTIDVSTPVPHTPTSEPTQEVTDEPTAAPEPTLEPTAEPTPEPSKATLMLVGDLMCLAGQQYAAYSQGNKQHYYFAPSFQYVKPIFDQADCVIGNLETALSSSHPYSTQEKNIDGMPNCNGPKTYLAALRYAGFDALVCANNHCCDAGSVGITETLQALEEYEFDYTGLFPDENAERFIILNVNGIKIGLLSYAEFYNSKEGPIISEGNGFMINTYSEEVIKRDVAAARAAGAEFIIAYNHWGKEHVHTPTEKVLMHAQQMADAGVDLIAGSHPHALQPIVNLTAADGRQVLCMYSLGNFVSSMGRDTANDTIIAEIELTRTNGGVSITSEEYHPCRVFSKLGGNSYVVVPTKTYLSNAGNMAELKEAEERIMSIILPEG